MTDWEPPRCRHGKILLGCPHDDCPEQNEYLADQNAKLDAHYARQQEEARRIVRQIMGLPYSPSV